MNGPIDIERLSRYFLSILPPEEETAVQEHLRTCPRCAARLEAMRKLRKGFEEDREASGRKTVASVVLIYDGGIDSGKVAAVGSGLAASQHRSGHDTGQHQGSNFLELHNEFFLLMVYKR